MYYDDENRGYEPPWHPPKNAFENEALCADTLRGIFADCTDFTSRTLHPGARESLTASFFFLDGLVSGSEAAETVLRPATDLLRLGSAKSEAEALDLILSGQVYGVTAQRIDAVSDAVTALLNGFVLLVFDGIGQAAAFEARTSNHRSIDEPKSEQSIKGARDSFVETLRINTSLLRRHLRSSALKFEKTSLGRKTNTRAELVWVDGVADPALLEKLRLRLAAVDVDGVLTASAVESALADTPRSPFPQLLLTERPDRFCLNLLEGRVGLLVDGLPFGWLLPATVTQQLRVTDDVSRHPLTSSALTLLRHLALLVTVLFPALYVAIAMYHQEMIPVRLLLSVIESKQSVPFSTAVEVLGMLVAFELLQEAGLRLPSAVGETVSIIGALIVGQSAVEAKVISPIAVIVVATAGIAGYTIPDQDLSEALRLTRFFLVLAAIGAGMFGIAAGCILLLWHLCSLDSFGVAYLAPAADGGIRELLRALTQPPQSRLKFRDRRLHTPDVRRRK